jgi:hypothetical protein
MKAQKKCIFIPKLASVLRSITQVGKPQNEQFGTPTQLVANFNL